MDAKRGHPLTTCAAIALGATLVTFFMDIHRLDATKTRDSLRWARQIISQTESLTQSAREKGERDPLGWAIGYLAQGVEPRIIRVYKTDDRTPSHPIENYRFDRTTGAFEYAKVFTPEGDSILHVVIENGFTGFLSTSSKFGSDLAFVGLFIVFFSAVTGWLRFKKPKADSGELRNHVIGWASEARGVLFQIGGSLKAMVVDAQRLADFSAKSYDSLRQLRQRIHGGLHTLHDARRALDDNHATARKIEELSVNLMIESRKTTVDPAMVGKLGHLLQKLSQQFVMQNQKSTDCLERIEIELEPWSVDADIAYHSFDGIVEATSGMNDSVRKTKEGALEQAKLIQALKTELSA